MDRRTAIDRLPEAYATALRLKDGGYDDTAIAARLDLAPEAVGPLLSMAAAKLRTLLAPIEEDK
jgi:DNA-directed RNA polymerase specialized sigma24 family protein